MANLELKPFQVDGVRLIHAKGGRALLADEMGLGKTAQALRYLGEIDGRPACIVSEASTKENWAREIRQWLGTVAVQLHGTTAVDTALTQAQPIYIVNYTILPHWIPWLKARGVKHVVLDECHNLTNSDSDRTLAVMDLVQGAKTLIAMSGTPMTNRPIDLWPVLHMLRPDIWYSRFAYMQRYCQPKLTPHGWEAKGAANLRELYMLLEQHVMIRRLKAQVLHDFPPKTRVTVPLELMDRAEYDAATGNLLKWLKQFGKGGQVVKAASNQGLYKVGELVRLAARLKLRAGVSWVNKWLADHPEEKLVVFTVNEPAFDVYMRRVNSPKIVGINGKTAPKKRQGLVDQFSHDPQTRVLVGNIKAAGVGLNMTKAHHVAFAEMWWAPYAHTQAEDRVHRIGQVHPCFAWYMVAMDTIEETIAKAIRTKQDIQDRAIDGLVAGTGTNQVNIYENVLDTVIADPTYLTKAPQCT